MTSVWPAHTQNCRHEVPNSYLQENKKTFHCFQKKVPTYIQKCFLERVFDFLFSSYSIMELSLAWSFCLFRKNKKPEAKNIKLLG